MSQQWKSENPGDEEDIQMPLGVGGEPAPVEEYVGPPSRVRVNPSTLALFGTFAAAIVVLYFLGLQNKPRAVSASEKAHQKELDDRIAKMLQSNGPQTAPEVSKDRSNPDWLKQVMEYFNKTAAPLEISGNPFEREEVRSASPTQPEVVTPITTTDIVKAKLLRDTAEEFSHMKLQGTMLGPTPAALIQFNGKTRMMTTGEKFKFLTVTAIGAEGVVLANETGDYRLIPDGGVDKNK